MILIQNPLRTVLAILLLGVLLAFPMGFSLFYKNIWFASHSLEKSPKILLFLNWGLSEQQAQDLQTELSKRSDIDKAVYISPLEGVKNLIEQLGLGNLLDKLSFNPLPAVIEVIPASSLNSANEVALLVDSLKTLPQVASAQINMNLVKQQFAYLNFWRSIFYTATIFLWIILILAMIFIMQMFFLMRVIVTQEKTVDRLFPSGIILGVAGAILGAILAAIVFHSLAAHLQFFLGKTIHGEDFWMIINLIFMGGLSGIVGTALAGIMGIPRPVQAVGQARTNS